MLQILALRGLAGFNDDAKWKWLPHDADWIYQGGPTGHLHDEYFNQYVCNIFGTTHLVTTLLLGGTISILLQ
jgi:hypothetical protein